MSPAVSSSTQANTGLSASFRTVLRARSQTWASLLVASNSLVSSGRPSGSLPPRLFSTHSVAVLTSCWMASSSLSSFSILKSSSSCCLSWASFLASLTASWAFSSSSLASSSSCWASCGLPWPSWLSALCWLFLEFWAWSAAFWGCCMPLFLASSSSSFLSFSVCSRVSCCSLARLASWFFCWSGFCSLALASSAIFFMSSRAFWSCSMAFCWCCWACCLLGCWPPC